MKKKVLPVAANFSLNKKAKNKKRGAFFWGHLFSWGKYMANISLEQCFFKKHLYKPHKTIYNADINKKKPHKIKIKQTQNHKDTKQQKQTGEY